jgi:hypothetical protein
MSSLEDEKTVPSQNIGHQSHSDTVAYPERMQTVNTLFKDNTT